ncbi:CocE/NonD family hydrolase [Mycolicibacterium komossense]|uniref:CocE/NonD family hydrolase n=1 Tax=Mycolicibacterium komossense TaxID=1779 RepID=A0ABT3CAM0_9MYCO|nr:CocE/NonD family hydrolase [Mycolicibacterium komossense]MCV7226513.1 CocE/NonD family hydrolase [Mycolicibacterium komossense]
MRMPAPTTEFCVHRDVRVPMRDGVELLADHYAPRTSSPAGTLLVRTPYPRKWPFTSLYGAIYAARGYHVIQQSVRGTQGSGGEFEPIVNEAADGHDTAAWLRDQPWFTGSFATIGLSYLGYTQWAMLSDPPPELAAAVITVGPHDFHEVSWGRGAFAVSDFLGWSDAMAHQDDPARLRKIVRGLQAGRIVEEVAGRAPMGAAARELLGTKARWYESWLAKPDAGDPYWVPRQMSAALEQVDVPILLLTGWQDTFLHQTLLQYRQLRDRGATVALTVGPWTHGQMTTRAAALVGRESLAWLGTHLAHQPEPDRSPVEVEIVHGGWVDLPDWPPATTCEQVMYLGAAGGLVDTLPAASPTPASFTFDPADPTPTIGGRLLSPSSGYRDDSALAERTDVISFTGAALASDLTVLGTPVVELAHTCDNPNHDVFVRLSEVDPKGRSRNVSDGFQRYTGDGDRAGLRLELDDIAYRFRAGHRIRVIIAGGSHPRYARNLGTDEPALTGRAMAPATHSVALGAGPMPSRLILPVDRQPTC